MGQSLGPGSVSTVSRRRLVVEGWERSYISDRPRSNHACGGWREEHWAPLRHQTGVAAESLLAGVATISPPAGYEDLTKIPDWAGPLARRDWYQDSEEWRLTIPKIWNLATRAPGEMA